MNNMMNIEAPRYNVYLTTNSGRVRSQNEDNFAINHRFRSLETPEMSLKGTDAEEPLVCSVLDGMGGEANGELASQLSAEVATLVYYELKKNKPVNLDALIGRFVSKSNSRIIEMLASTKAKRGGSTFVMAVFYQGMVNTYSLGDSRIYLYRDHRLMQISNDQTLAMKKLRANIITEEEALTTSDRHKLTSFLGVDMDDEGLSPQIYRPFVLEKGDKLLLCSDGLYDMCMDDEIERLMSKRAGDACLALSDAALANGGQDNITVMVIERA